MDWVNSAAPPRPLFNLAIERMSPLSSSALCVALYNRGILFCAIRVVKLALCVLLGCLSSPAISGAQVKPVKRVLIFYELGLSSPTVGLVDQELHEALASTPYEEVGGYVESLPAEGRIVGEIASRILKGEKVQDIPIA